MSETIFDKLIRGEIAAWKVWEDADYLAFLTPFPNTPGFTVVIPKQNVGDYIFGLDAAAYDGLLHATRTVAHLLEIAFKTPRIALVFEGTGVAHVHAKLIPLHGELASQTNVASPETTYSDVYSGWITTAEGPRMADAELDRLQNMIINAAKESA